MVSRRIKIKIKPRKIKKYTALKNLVYALDSDDLLKAREAYLNIKYRIVNVEGYINKENVEEVLADGSYYKLIDHLLCVLHKSTKYETLSHALIIIMSILDYENYPSLNKLNVFYLMRIKRKLYNSKDQVAKLINQTKNKYVKKLAKNLLNRIMNIEGSI